MNVIVSERAERDLTDIALYIAEDSPRRAHSFVDELFAACAELSSGPERFAVLAGYEEIGYRRRPYGRYLIINRIGEDNVTIVRVLSSAVDIAAALG